MNAINSVILTINAGSSSIKMSLYEIGSEPVLQLSGKIEKIGSGDSNKSVCYSNQ
jgi:acetate kinase